MKTAAALALAAALMFSRTPFTSTADLGALDAAAPEALANPVALDPIAALDASTNPAAAAAPDAPSILASSPPLTADITTAGVLSSLERAHAQLLAEGLTTQLIVVSPSSTGVALAIFRDLRIRHYRSTTGPDEGIDTHSLACYPACVFVPVQEINVLTVDRWVAVLRHEYHHVIQARNNPNLARDFRDPNGVFTSYGLFSEVCADYGVYVAPGYGARTRMSALKRTLGPSRQPLIDQACAGSKPAYDTVVQTYNQIRRSSRAFAAVFPRYR